jgi:hypothetical protein
VPAHPNAARFAGVSATLTTKLLPGAPSTIRSHSQHPQSLQNPGPRPKPLKSLVLAEGAVGLIATPASRYIRRWSKIGGEVARGPGNRQGSRSEGGFPGLGELASSSFDW